MAFPMMHPDDALLIADDHAEHLAVAATAGRRRRDRGHDRARSIRRRAGWALVALGLHLVVGSERPLTR